jgi:acetyl esterase/lipase
MGLIYPGGPANPAFTRDTPPAFLLSGENDGDIALALPRMFLSLKAAGVPAELHVLGGAPHGFGMRAENPPAVANWIVLFRLWLEARGFLTPP